MEKGARTWCSDHPPARDAEHSGNIYSLRYIPGVGNIPLGKLGEGVEIKGDGGYIIVPPSEMLDKRGYTTVSDKEIAAAPEWLLAKLREHYNTR